MADVTQDIVVSDNYGRTKRASLLYSAVLIVLGIAVSRPPAFDVNWLGMEVPLRAAKLLAWLAAGYYTLIFVIEWRVARIINSKAMANEFGGGVNSRLREFADRFKGYAERIGETSSEYVKASEGVTGNIEQFSRAIVEQQNAYLNYQHPDASIHVNPNVGRYLMPGHEERNTTLERLTYFENMLKTDVKIVQSRAAENLEVYRGILGELSKLATDFKTLADRFNVEQKVMFYFLDLGAVVFLFLAGTLVAGIALLHS